MRYLILVMLNLPIILLALINIVTGYKMKRINKNRFKHQIILWATILIVLLSSYPAYNLAIGNSLFSSEELSALDIVQTTVIVILFYIINSQRQKIESTEKTLKLLHSALSIRLSDNEQP